MLELLKALFSVLSILWLILNVAEKFGIKVPFKLMDHSVMKLWKLQEVGVKRSFHWKDAVPVYMFYFVNSFVHPELDRIFAYLSLTLMVAILTVEPIVLFRRKYPKGTLVFSLIAIMMLTGGSTLTVVEFLKVF